MFTPSTSFELTRPTNVLSPSEEMSELWPVMSTYGGGTPSGNSWGTSLEGVAYPFQVNDPVVAYEAYFVQGPVGTGNFDIAVFEMDGTKVVGTGTTAKAAATAHINVALTDTVLGPNKRYYMGMCHDTGTDTFIQWATTAGLLEVSGVVVWTEASLPIDSTVTFSRGSRATLPVLGLNCRSTAF